MTQAPPPGPWVSQTHHPRVVIPASFLHGGACTLILERLAETWSLYRLGITEPVILVADADLRAAAGEILDRAS